MGALTIAFDTTIVGALALPWVILVIHLFFLEGESSIEVLLRWIRRQNQPAVAGVLLFAWPTPWGRLCLAPRRIFSTTMTCT